MTIIDKRYIESPKVLPIRDFYNSGREAVFLAGGISGTQNWQKEAAKKLLDETSLYVVNPRREGVDLAKSGHEAAAQIQWEFEHLRACRLVLFWFPKETVCPIALFELGTFLGRGRDYAFSENSSQTDGEFPWVFVGCDPDYSRRFDLEQQIGLYDPRVKLRLKLDDVVEDVSLAAKAILKKPIKR
tara:strand:+ start:50321 stop:50878 length:558 start_codon:yes stop_codon:yes gene_type:complete